MLGNMPIIESREEVYCRKCERYTEMLRHILNGQPTGAVLNFAWNVSEGYKERPKHLDCEGCVTGGVYGDKKLIASMKKLRAGVDTKTREVIEQSVGEFLAGCP